MDSHTGMVSSDGGVNISGSQNYFAASSVSISTIEEHKNTL
jgi:hypothetical protein